MSAPPADRVPPNPPGEQTRTSQPHVEVGTLSFAAPDGTGTFAPQRGAADAQPVPVIPGYEVLESVGHGGMGRVFRARQLATNRVVAVKLLLAGEFAGASARERFKAEIETTARLSHPHIIQLFEAGEADGRAFLSCEFVGGGSLAARLDGTPWEAKRAARLLVPLARAVAYAHASGVVHRDLKPANILLALDGTPKVADFGIAKQMGSDSHTHTGAILGTPSYMPPEQAGSAKAVGGSADVYALGAILYELLTGRPPFKGADFVETIDLVRTQEPVPPHVLQPKLPRDIETVCLKCLQKDPAKRYPTADALADDMGRFLEGRPIVARPVGAVERGWRWAKRNPAVASLVAAVLLVFAAGAGIASYFAVEASSRAREADAERIGAEAARERTEELLYAAQIFQAHVSAVEYRTERLNQLLDDTRPQPGRPDRRGWEWHYLHRLSRSWDVERKLDFRSPPFAGFAPPNERLSWSFSPDGACALVCAHPDSLGMVDRVAVTRAGLFDTATGRLIREVPALKTPPDAAESNHTVDLELRSAVSVELCRRVEELPPGAAGPPREVIRYRVRLVNLETGVAETPLPELETAPQAWVSAGGNRIVLTPGGGFFLSVPPAPPSVGPETSAQLDIWDRGRPGLVRSVIRPEGEVKHINVSSVSPDAMTAVISYAEASASGRPGGLRLELWDISGKPARRGPTHPVASEWINPGNFSADGGLVTVHEGTRTVGVYDARTGGRVGRWEPPTDLCSQSAGGWFVSRDGYRLAGIGPNAMKVVADRAGGPARPAVQDDIGVWRAGVLRPPFRKSGRISAQHWLAPDGRRLSTGDNEGTYREWDLSRLPGHASIWPEKIRLGDDFALASAEARGRWVLYCSTSVGNEKRTKPFRAGVYDTQRRAMVTEFDVTATQWVGGVPSRDGRRVLLNISDVNPAPTTVFDQPRSHWSLRTVEDPTRELAGGQEDITAFSEDGRWVVASHANNSGLMPTSPPNRVRVYRVADGGLASEVRAAAKGAIVSRAWAGPAGVLVVTAYPEIQSPPAGQKPDPVPLTFQFHDIETGAVRGEWTAPVPYPAVKGFGGVYDVLLSAPFFSPDGRKVAISRVAEDGSIRAWVLDATTGALEGEFAASSPAGGRPAGANETPGWPDRKGAFGPDGRLAVWADRDLVVWTGPGSAPVRLPGHEFGKTVVFTADGRRAFTLDTGNFDRETTLRVWELPEGRELFTVRVVDELNDFSMTDGDMWLEGERLHVLTPTGVRVFDGTPRKE